MVCDVVTWAGQRSHLGGRLVRVLRSRWSEVGVCGVVETALLDQGDVVAGPGCCLQVIYKTLNIGSLLLDHHDQLTMVNLVQARCLIRHSGSRPIETLVYHFF